MGKKPLNAIDQIEWNGKTWSLYQGEHYYQHNGERLHRAVYRHYFGEIPQGYHVHHVDGDVQNNSPENLILLPASEHARLHMSEESRKSKQAEVGRTGWESLDAKRREWAKTPEGKRWYKEHWKESIGKSMTPIEKECAHCHGKFVTTSHRSNARFCSNNCKMKARTRRLKGLPEDAVLPKRGVSKSKDSCSTPMES